MRIVLGFPQKLWRIVNKYYNTRRSWCEKSCLMKLSEIESENDIINKFIKDSSARKVVIIKELDEETKTFLENSFKDYNFNIISEENNNFNTDRINILTVDMAKGMEFDSTLIFTKGMNNNEMYISLTRSLINNYVILN